MRWNDIDRHFMRLALDLARSAPAAGEIPIAAALVHEEKVLASAHNLRESRQDPTAHAELLAIRKAADRLRTWRLTDSTLYVTLEPCLMCAGAIIQARIARLVFGAWDPKAGACGSLFDIPSERRLNHRVEVLGGLLEEECQAILQSFFRAKRGGGPAKDEPFSAE
ncbi:MAG: tRNA adenosine(34) deaminase TadA [Nitrospira sp.]|nr:tRNA adenosine(34) deaminase TadA [Nitrospira sp.]